MEWERDLRRMPDDPALITPETEFTTGVPPGTPIQWALARQGFPRAWDVTTGAGGIVGALDTGVDGGNPEFAGKIASADAAGASAPLTDEDGHGSHTAGLACAGTDNGIGLAGAGLRLPPGGGQAGHHDHRRHPRRGHRGRRSASPPTAARTRST